jgi:predicted polyphosphate/ATP-dependent NAD kinase
MKQKSESTFDMPSNTLFRLGFLVNPVAGVGGTVALKGSDGVVAEALARGAIPQAGARAEAVLAALLPWREQVLIVTAAGAMGGDSAQALGFQTRIMHTPAEPSSARDTEAAARALQTAHVDLLLFAGGDGTARDICHALGASVPALGIPAGVKMHSGVFAVNPRGAAEIVQLLLRGESVLIDNADVRDIDETALREGRVQSRHFGELRVPVDGRFLQQVKCSGVEVEELLLQEIGADVADNLEAGVTYFVGPGTTPAAVMNALDLPNTLLGIDVLRDGELLAADVDAPTLERYVSAGPCRLIMTATGGQGMLLGRGNQQITPAVLSAIGREGLIVVATQEKLKALQGRPLLLDIPDEKVAQDFSGFVEVITGYGQHVLYRVAAHG